MRIGIFAGARREVDNLERLTQQVKQAEDGRFQSLLGPALVDVRLRRIDGPRGRRPAHKPY